MDRSEVNTPELMDFHEKMQLRAAAMKATRLYPGPVGMVLAKELRDWEEFGYRFGSASLVRQLYEHIMKTPTSNGSAA